MVASVFDSDVAREREPMERTSIDDDARLRACVAAHLGSVWRMLRRHGVSAADADDASQRVFVVLSRKLGAVDVGSELPFLLRTAALIASETRRTQRRRRESDVAPPDIEAPASHGPDVAMEHREALAHLDAILDRMDGSLRTVFVLHEIEELTMAAIAATLDLPPGTVASRLRRAREQFESMCQRGVE